MDNSAVKQQFYESMKTMKSSIYNNVIQYEVPVSAMMTTDL